MSLGFDGFQVRRNLKLNLCGLVFVRKRCSFKGAHVWVELRSPRVLVQGFNPCVAHVLVYGKCLVIAIATWKCPREYVNLFSRHS